VSLSVLKKLNRQEHRAGFARNPRHAGTKGRKLTPSRGIQQSCQESKKCTVSIAKEDAKEIILEEILGVCLGALGVLAVIHLF
jgi:hypothetical protein